MGRATSASRRIPAWLRELGVPVWLSGPDQTIVYINALAARFLGIACREATGLKCHQLVGARDEHGDPICRPRCALSRQAGEAGPLRPIRTLLLDGRGEERWLRLLPIRVQVPGIEGACVAHCGLDDERAHRVESYLGHVARRSGAGTRQRGEPLTPREWQVLDLLAEDRAVREIAARLGVSYATVRNHVQHLLRKLEMHSIAEAVAFHLLQNRPRP